MTVVFNKYVSILDTTLDKIGMKPFRSAKCEAWNESYETMRDLLSVREK